MEDHVFGKANAGISEGRVESVKRDVAPFLSKHIPELHTPQNTQTFKPNTKYCYRHRPDLKCRRQADELLMGQLQKGMDKLPPTDQQAITHVWNLFSAAPAPQRNLMLQGILSQCCFPQLSLISNSLRDLIRIDFLTALPTEISFKILSYLDTTSLCKAAQVSQRWRMLADDDVVWHRMCEQHIDRKCTECGWGLPLLERKRLRATKRQIQLRASNFSRITEATDNLSIGRKRRADDFDMDSESGSGTPSKLRITEGDSTTRSRPWKEIYEERWRVECNWRRGRCNMKVFKGHTNGVMCLQFDDNILATGSYDTTVKIWDIETGECLRTLSGHQFGVRALMFDESKLISGSMDKTLKIWNWRNGECLRTINAHTDGVVALHFDEKLLVSGSVDKTVKVWNFEDSSCTVLRGHSDWVNAVRIHTASRTVFSASDDTEIRLWDLDTKSCIRVFKGHVGQVQQVLPIQVSDREDEEEDSGFFPETPGRPSPPANIITSGLDCTMKVWDVKTGKCTGTLFGHVEGVWGIAADSLRLVSGGQDRMVKVWDVKTGKCRRTITGHSGPVTCVGLSDSKLVTGSEDSEIRLYDFKSAGDVSEAQTGWGEHPALTDYEPSSSRSTSHAGSPGP
ncbi:WD40 repeat-like protein [Ascobolus immersus RN42]|uniref:WD40 repeat-like protein n=1 Tax=Ascobolus immersus RN42 TaxID=1160509 RepID=A0A3N4IC21_ASCIM|nr:WD40 repeat-like protein [Ascobolus immersus RN42]